MPPNIKPLISTLYRSMPRNRVAVLSWSVSLLVFAAILMALFYFRPIFISIAVSRADVVELKIAQLLLEHSRSKSSRLRLSVIQTQSPEDALQMLEQGQVEMAIGRPDMKMPESSTSVAVLRQMQPFFALNLPKGGSEEVTPAWLKGKVIGYPNIPSSNRAFLEAILRHWQLLGSVTLVEIAPGQLVSIAQSRKLDALFTVNAASVDASGNRVLEALKIAFSRGFGVLPLADSASLIGKIPGLEEGTIPRGLFRASPPLPSEELTSASIASNLITVKGVSDDAIVATVKALLALKESQLSRTPELANIAEPSKTNRSLAINSVAAKVHEGIYEDFFDRYANQIYIGMALLGGIASVGSAAYRRQRQAITSELSADLATLLALQDSLSQPLDSNHFEQVQIQAESIYRLALESAARGQISGGQLMAVHLAYSRLADRGSAGDAQPL